MVSFGIVDSCDDLFWHVWVTLHFSLSRVWSLRMSIYGKNLACFRHFARACNMEVTLH